ncbi:RNA polymerase sigma-70 factor, ECF subfamily [Lihuaxuella thermophila]|uniref:RNA polymerase sigma-70 factor, ECF subfamily n=1 Tax=Lihuaxuella thermophila TaxID=1173111 RepID=A0A1H8BQ05_9BACL|nr:RNA polymerase sigma-70 factor, ECF subfamily [Lihuaxuella thermophila]
MLPGGILPRDQDCLDAIQETILKAYQGIDRLKRPAYFKTWLIRILINQCNEMIRKNKKIYLLEEIKETYSANAELEKIELREAVNKLEADQRIVVFLHYFEDISLKDIADMLDIPVNTVKTRLHRARRALANMLEISPERKVGYE